MFEAILLMLRVDNDSPDPCVATPSSLEAYFTNFQATSCPAAFGPQWSEVFVAASEDARHWSREVRHPAVGCLARGRSKVPGRHFGEDLQPTKKTQSRISKT